MNYFELIYDYKQRLAELKNEIITLRIEEKNKLEDFEQRIEEEYLLKREENHNEAKKVNAELKNINYLIHSYAIFKIKDISEILRLLVSSFTEDDYYIKEEKLVDNIVSPLGLKKNRVAILIGQKNFQTNFIGVASILSSSGFVLVEKDENDELMQFYDELGNFNNSVYESDLTRPNLGFGPNFSYVKEFIDYVINYRIENNLKDITFDNLLDLLQEFVSLNKKANNSNKLIR